MIRGLGYLCYEETEGVEAVHSGEGSVETLQHFLVPKGPQQSWTLDKAME